MSIHDTLAQDADLLALAGAMRSTRLADAAFKLWFLRNVLAKMEPGAELDLAELLIAAEDFEFPYSSDEVAALVRDCGMLEPLGRDRFRVRDALHLGNLFQVPRSILPRAVSLRENAHLRPAQPVQARSANESPSLKDCAGASRRASQWGIEVVEKALLAQGGGLCGVPPFWNCIKEEHSPFVQVGGSMTTVETLLLLVDQARFGMKLLLGAEQARADAIVRLGDLLMSLQDREDRWTSGALIMAGEDDDFVDSFNPITDAGRGACPTVDATATLLRALCLLHRPELASALAHHAASEAPQPAAAAVAAMTPQCQATPRLEDWPDRLAVAIRQAAGFVLRMRSDAGGWGILRYPDDRPPTPVREPSCKMAIEGLAAACASGLLDEAAQVPILRAVEDYLQMVRGAAHPDDHSLFWQPFFSPDPIRDAASLGSTMWVCHSLLAIARTWPELRSEAQDLLGKGVAYLCEHWTPNAESFISVAVRVPTWVGWSSNERFSWELPTDPFVATLLLDYHRHLGSEPKPDEWRRINQAVVGALALETHGHWNDFLLKKNRGLDKAMPGNTLHYCQLLWSYLSYVHDRLGVLFV